MLDAAAFVSRLRQIIKREKQGVSDSNFRFLYLRSGMRIRIRSDPDLFAGSGSESFPLDPDPDPVSGSFPSYIKMYSTIICELSFFKF